MKKCPYCGAAVEDNAKFCLYCMKELEKKAVITENPLLKKKQIIFLISLFIVITAAVVFSFFNYSKSDVSNKKDNSDAVVSDKNSAVNNEDLPGGNKFTSDKENVETDSGFGSNQNDNAEENNVLPVPNNTNNTNNTDTDNTDKNNKQENPDINNSGNNLPVKPDVNNDSSLPTDPCKPTHKNILYTYKPAESFAGYGQNNPKKDIVITGVSTKADDGVYIIPETIDGKNVVAIKNDSFCSPLIALSVRTVVLPASVKCIHKGAFLSCENIKDIYIMSEKLEIENGSIAPEYARKFTTVFHSSSSCKERHGQLLGDFVKSRFNAEWQNWDKTVNF